MSDWRFSKKGDKIDLASLRIAAGDFPLIVNDDKFGFNNDVGTSEETIWDAGGIYAYPAAALTMTLSSSDADDTAAGSGAQTVEVQGLAAEYADFSGTFSLDGQSGVTVTSDLLRGHRLEVKSAGVGDTNAGTIYLGSGTITSGVPAIVYAQIQPGQGQTLMAVYTVPAGKTLYIWEPVLTTARVAAASVDSRLLVRPFGGVFLTKRRFVTPTSSGSPPTPRRFPLKVNEKSDIEIRATGSAANMDVSAEFEFLQVDW